MAKTVLPIAGAVVGFWVGGPAGAQWGYAAGSLLASAIPNQVQGPRIGETGAQTSHEGASRAIVYGTAQVTGNIIASGPLIKRDVETNEGKGGTDVSTEHAYRTFAVRACEGTEANFLRVWEDDKLVYDIRTGSTLLAESQKWAANKIFYSGAEEQLPDPNLQMIFGLEEVPAHRGSAYMVAVEEDLTDRRGSVAQYRFEVSVGLGVLYLEKVPTRFADGLSGGGLYPEGRSIVTILDDVGPGQTWHISVAFSPNPASSPQNLILFLKVGGEIVWSSGFAIDLDNVLKRFQINHVSGATEIEYGFIGEFYGGFDIRMTRLDTDDAYSVLSDDYPPPVVYEDDNPYFGVIIGGNAQLYAAGQVATSFGLIAWGPDSITLPGNAASAALSDVVSNIHDRCNFPLEKIDVSELTDTVSGFVLAGEYTGADAINTLRSLYLFDCSDQDKTLVYPKRGKAVVATITEGDIVDSEESTKREQAIEYPKKLHLSYQNAEGGYALAQSTSSRSSPDVRVVGEVTTQVPVVLNTDQAAQAAAIMHKIAWAEAEGETTLSVPLSWIKFIASDCFGVALRGRVTRERLDELNYADGVIAYTLRRDRQSAYTSNVTGIPIALPTPPPSTIVGETMLAVLDIPARIDTEDDLSLLYAVSGGLPAWGGAVVQRSVDAGASYVNAASINRAAIMGHLINDLAGASEHYTDTTNVVRVQLIRDGQAIDQITETQFLSEGGALAIMRPDGSAEILQHRDAAEVSGGVYDLSVLHRGVLNSGSSAHLAGALLVFLARAVHVPAQSAWIGSSLTHRAVSYSESPETAAEQTETYVGRSQIEWPVAYLRSTVVGDVVSASWSPRHRFGADVAPIASINFLGYRVQLDDGVDAVSWDTTDTAITRDAAALSPPVRVTVRPLNRITGPGPAVSTDPNYGAPFVPAGPTAEGIDIGARYALLAGDDIIVAHTLQGGAALLWRLNQALIGDSINVSVAADVTGIARLDDVYFVCMVQRGPLNNGKGLLIRVEDDGSGLAVTHSFESSYIINDLCVCDGSIWAADYSGSVLRFSPADLAPEAVVPASPAAYRLASDGIWVYALRQDDVLRIDPAINDIAGTVWTLYAPSSTADLRTLGRYLVLSSSSGLQIIDPDARAIVRARSGVGGLLTVVPGLIGCGGAGSGQVVDSITLQTISTHADTWGLSVLDAGRAVVSYLNTPGDLSSGQWLQLLKRS